MMRIYRRLPIALCAVTLAVAGLVATLSVGRVSAQAPIVHDLKALNVSGAGLYTPNKAPLEPAAVMKLPIGSITPKGWLRNQLQLDADGMSGHLEDISHFLKFDGNGWVDPRSNNGWEELPYWLRGYGDLGYVLGDARINADS